MSKARVKILPLNPVPSIFSQLEYSWVCSEVKYHSTVQYSTPAKSWTGLQNLRGGWRGGRLPEPVFLHVSGAKESITRNRLWQSMYCCIRPPQAGNRFLGFLKRFTNTCSGSDQLIRLHALHSLPVRGRIQTKTWCKEPYAGVDYNLPYVNPESTIQQIGQPRIDLNPMPESTVSPSQGLWIWPQ